MCIEDERFGVSACPGQEIRIRKQRKGCGEMRIALMTNNFKPIVGGVPISIERLAGGLEELGHEVTIFAPTYKERQHMAADRYTDTETGDMGIDRRTDTETGDMGIDRCTDTETGDMTADMHMDPERNVFRYSTCLNHFIGGIVLPNPFDLRIEREFREHPYDIIHVHHPMLIGRTAVYLSRKYHIPLVFTYHTRYEQYVAAYTKGLLKMEHIMPLYLRGFLRHCSFVFAPTEGMREYLTDTCRVWPEKVGVLPTGIEKSNFDTDYGTDQKIRRQYGAEHIPFLLTVSRMAGEKNVSFLLESLALVKEKYGKPFRMLMVGDGPDREALQRQSLKLGLGDFVTFTGAVANEEIAPYFRAADAFLFASKTETQGIVVLEAFAGATPVIAVKASGVEDLVDDGVNGILTREDREEYAAAVTGFLREFCAESDRMGIYMGSYVSAQGVGRQKELCTESAREHTGAGVDDVCLDNQTESDTSNIAFSDMSDTASGERPAKQCGETMPRRLSCRELSRNAYQKGTLYREEAVALKAVHYYNSVIAENAMQKKRNIRLLPTG